MSSCPAAVGWTTMGYRSRQNRSRLRVAECQVETMEGRERLRLLPGGAPLVAPDWWGSAQM